jgi:uncharacterized protein with HEPN domain
MSNRSPASDLLEMARAVDRIASYASTRDREAFCADTMAYDAVLMNLIVIGEACSRLPREVLSM